MEKDDSLQVRQLAKLLKNPFYLALVKIIKLYIEFNAEDEDKILKNLVKKDDAFGQHIKESL